MNDLSVLMRRGEVLGIPGMTWRILKALETGKKLKTVPIPGRKRKLYRRADVMRALGM